MKIDNPTGSVIFACSDHAAGYWYQLIALHKSNARDLGTELLIRAIIEPSIALESELLHTCTRNLDMSRRAWVEADGLAFSKSS